MVGPCSSAEVVAATVPARRRVAMVFIARRAQADRWSARSTGHPENNLRELVDIGIVVSSGASDVTPQRPDDTGGGRPGRRVGSDLCCGRATGGRRSATQSSPKTARFATTTRAPASPKRTREVLMTLDDHRRR